MRAKMAAAQQARWAKIKGTARATADSDEKPPKKRRKMSAAGRAKIAAAARARWAKVKAEGNKGLYLEARGPAYHTVGSEGRYRLLQ